MSLKSSFTLSKKNKIGLLHLYAKESKLNNTSYTLSHGTDNTNSLMKTVSNPTGSLLTPVDSHNQTIKRKHLFLCDSGESCPNYKALKELEMEYYKCKHINEQLNKMNMIFKSSLNQKTRMCMTLLNDSTIMNPLNKSENDQTIPHNESIRPNITLYPDSSSHSITQNNPPNLKRRATQKRFVSFRTKQNSPIKLLQENNYDKKKFYKQMSCSNNKTNNEFKNKNIRLTAKHYSSRAFPIVQVSNNHYDFLLDFTNRNLQFNSLNNVSISLLSTDKDFNALIKDNNSLTILNPLIASDQKFIQEMTTATSSNLIAYCDAINFLIKDYKELIKLNIRVKDFINASINLVESALNHTSISVLINNTCKILDCDRATVFIHDKITDMLVVHSGEGLKKSQIKIPKDKGIVGYVFMSGKSLKIDDVYLDLRFNKEIDIKTNYKTRNMLCYPLINADGLCYGCIQAINKNAKVFDLDDEELLKFFSQQASAILAKIIDTNEYSSQFGRYKAIIEYSLDINKIKSLEELTLKTEDFLINVFTCFDSQLLFFYNQQLYHIKCNEKKTYLLNTGLINLSRTRMEIIGCRSLKTSCIYNCLIDLESTDGLITFPFKVNDNICGIAQIPSSFKLNQEDQPIKHELTMIKLIIKCLEDWCKNNIELFY